MKCPRHTETYLYPPFFIFNTVRAVVKHDQRRPRRSLKVEVSSQVKLEFLGQIFVIQFDLKIQHSSPFLLLLVAVMGHVGLTPQSISVIGGFRAQGRTAVRARKLLDEALRLQDAGAFAIVLECIPPNVAVAITDAIEIPTIGIGAGGGTSGQVLVYHDMLGMTSHPHHKQFVPKFCKQYATLGHTIIQSLEQFRSDVEASQFPGEEYAPYKMTKEENAKFRVFLTGDEEERRHKQDETIVKLSEANEYEVLALYGKK